MVVVVVAAAAVAAGEDEVVVDVGECVAVAFGDGGDGGPMDQASRRHEDHHHRRPVEVIQSLAVANRVAPGAGGVAPPLLGYWCNSSKMPSPTKTRLLLHYQFLQFFLLISIFQLQRNVLKW